MLRLAFGFGVGVAPKATGIAGLVLGFGGATPGGATEDTVELGPATEVMFTAAPTAPTLGAL